MYTSGKVTWLAGKWPGLKMYLLLKMGFSNRYILVYKRINYIKHHQTILVWTSEKKHHWELKVKKPKSHRQAL